MPAPGSVDVWKLADLCTPWCIHVVVTLRVPDLLAAGPRPLPELAAAAGADADALARVLRHLVGEGVLEEPRPDCFALTEPAHALVGPGPRLGMDLDGFGGRVAHAWSSLLAAVRTGRPAYASVFGRGFWEDLAAHPEIAATFDALMGPEGHGTPDPEVLLAGDWDAIETVVDVGGGTGALLAEVLRVHPHVRGVLVDLPSTVARSRAQFEAAGVADRTTTAPQSFFEPLPAGADLYLLKSVLSDWPDREAALILQRCAEAARPAGRVVLVNGVTPDEDGPAPPDLLMLVLVGGKARTLAELRALAEPVGLRVHAAARQASGRYLVELRPGGPV